ncbi:MAG: hypothetical protein HQL77_17890 [Magnetococcales bacterium]|nr:hypothetical protein [Magnetococcales bacterium]MBF0437217.1 hypothetical protein [Magnetococcales bacterium]
MNFGPLPPRSCLARFQPVRLDPEREKLNGWKNHRILVVAANDPRLGWPEREMINHLAKKLFGQKVAKEVTHD